MTDLSGNVIQDATGHIGFPGFDGMEATVSLSYVAQMQEAGIPITYAYISDAHDGHGTSGNVHFAYGPGEAGYVRRERDPLDRRRVVIRLIQERAVSDVGSVFLPMVRAWQKIASRYSDDELRLIVEFYGQMEEVLRQHIAVLRDSGQPGQAPAPR